MSRQERLEAVTQTLEPVAQMHAAGEKRIEGLERVTELHQERLDSHERRLDKLES
jgi:hypothetical protein